MKDSNLIDLAFENKMLLEQIKFKKAVFRTIELLDRGEIRVAEKYGKDWKVNEWIKKAIILYFSISKMKLMEVGPFEFFDRIPLKKKYKSLRIRVVPPGVARYGSYLEPGVILMPGYVNIGAYVGSGTMIDTHANVGSCAQVGKYVHLAGAVRIGGVLEPPQAKPVIVEDYAFIGSAVSLMEGVIVREEAVLGSGVMLTGSTKIFDVSYSRPIEYQGEIPPRSVVIPGSYIKEFPAGKYNVPCALIIGQRKETTDKKTSLNYALREFDITV